MIRRLWCVFVVMTWYVRDKAKLNVDRQYYLDLAKWYWQDK